MLIISQALIAWFDYENYENRSGKRDSPVGHFDRSDYCDTTFP